MKTGEDVMKCAEQGGAGGRRMSGRGKSKWRVELLAVLLQLLAAC